jgi:hypothetical protein
MAGKVRMEVGRERERSEATSTVAAKDEYGCRSVRRRGKENGAWTRGSAAPSLRSGKEKLNPYFFGRK